MVRQHFDKIGVFEKNVPWSITWALWRRWEKSTWPAISCFPRGRDGCVRIYQKEQIVNCQVASKQWDTCIHAHITIHHGKLGCACHLLMRADSRDMDVSAKTKWAEFKFTSLIYLANTACLRQHNKTVAKQNTSSSKEANKVFNILKCSLR